MSERYLGIAMDASPAETRMWAPDGLVHTIVTVRDYTYITCRPGTPPYMIEVYRHAHDAPTTCLWCITRKMR